MRQENPQSKQQKTGAQQQPQQSQQKEYGKSGMGESTSKIENFLKGMDYPAGKSALTECAKENNAPREVIDQLNQLPEQQFQSAAEVNKHLQQGQSSKTESAAKKSSSEQQGKSGNPGQSGNQGDNEPFIF